MSCGLLLFQRAQICKGGKPDYLQLFDRPAMRGVIILERQYRLFAITFHQRGSVCFDIPGFVDVADVALKMDVEASEAQMPGGGRSPIMASMPGERRFSSAGNTAPPLRQLGLAANVVYSALRQVNPVLQRFNCCFALAPGGSLFFLCGALFGRLLALCRLPDLSGLLLADGAGAFVAANRLRIAHRMEPLAAFFVGALPAR